MADLKEVTEARIQLGAEANAAKHLTQVSSETATSERKNDFERNNQTKSVDTKLICEIIEKSSCNHPNETIKPQFIILHCIGFDEDTALKILTKPVSEGGGGVSAHFLIPQVKGRSPYPIYNLVPTHKKALHAGVSSWRGATFLNTCSIGIEFHSPNYARALQKQAGECELDWFHFEDFLEEQIEAGIQLILNLMKEYHIKPENVLGHSDIAPYREDSNKNIILGKTDPGLTFPWEKLAKAGIGVWPKRDRTRSDKLDTSLKNVQTLLNTYGYSLPVTGELDLKTQYVISAFQLHFMPKHFSPKPCDDSIFPEMIICLENLIDGQLEYCDKPSNIVNTPTEITIDPIALAAEKKRLLEKTTNVDTSVADTATTLTFSDIGGSAKSLENVKNQNPSTTSIAKEADTPSASGVSDANVVSAVRTLSST